MNFVVDWPPYFRLSLEQKICVNVCSERNVTTFSFVHNQIKSEVKKNRGNFSILFDNSFFLFYVLFAFSFLFLDGPLLLITWYVWNVVLLW